MNKLFKIMFLIILLTGLTLQSVNAYDIPQRKIEVKPYFNFFFPNDLWETITETSVVDNKTSFGLGMKIRTQFNNQIGIVFNASYVSFKTLNNASSEGMFFTGGGYYAKSFGFGNLTFDLGYGVISAADEILGLLMPSFEYSRSISERMSIAVEFGLPIPNDWPRDFAYKEKIGSLTLSVGTIFIF